MKRCFGIPPEKKGVRKKHEKSDCCNGGHFFCP
jgi:hypothetical protein